MVWLVQVQQQWTLSKARAQALKDRASGLQRDSERHAAEAAEAEQQVQQVRSPLEYRAECARLFCPADKRACLAASCTKSG